MAKSHIEGDATANDSSAQGAAPSTTPDPITVQRIFSEMLQQEC